ncbi:ligase-associated DNA damage response endonuclease PdeM [Sphingobacterium hungaricum]
MAKKLDFNGVEVFLLPQKAVFVPLYNTLVISDWHLGKLGHFRQEGLFVPPMQLVHEFARVEELLLELPVKKVIFLGDLFHSNWNTEWDEFVLFLKKYPQIEFILTKGNHDILPKAMLHSALQIKDEYLLAEGLVFSHQPITGLPDFMFNIVGHIHPGCVITTKGRQHFRLPCFHLEDKVLTVPAFGKWTGLHILHKDEDSRIFAVVGDGVVEV